MRLKAVRCYLAMMGASAATAPDTPLNARMSGKSALPRKGCRSLSDSDHPAAAPLSLRLGRASPEESSSFANPLTRADTSATASCKLVTISTELPNAAFAAASPAGDDPHSPTNTCAPGARRRMRCTR